MKINDEIHISFPFLWYGSHSTANYFQILRNVIDTINYGANFQFTREANREISDYPDSKIVIE